jgi:glutamate racemase
MRIGVFDSGVGGLSVLREIRRLLPEADLVYLADSAYCPYGRKSPAEVLERACAITCFLVEQHDARLIVVACNTATVAAVDELRKSFEPPIVGMEPGVKPAAAATRTGVVGVLATGVTLAGSRFNRLVQRYAEGVEVITQPCPGLVEQVESGDLTTPDLVTTYVHALTRQKADTLVLGCTHYPFLRPLIAEAAGPGVVLIDTGPAVARQVERVLGEAAPGAGTTRFFTTSETAASVIEKLWGAPADVTVTCV